MRRGQFQDRDRQMMYPLTAAFFGNRGIANLGLNNLLASSMNVFANHILGEVLGDIMSEVIPRDLP
jgi:hypothetical protein